MFKLFILHCKRFFRRLFKNVGMYVSVLFLLISVITSLALLLPNIFHKTPIIGYLIETTELPLSYELNGTITIIESNGVQPKQNINVYIGGYNIATKSGEPFTMYFSSQKTEQIFLTIILENADGTERIITKEIKTNSKTILNEEVIIYV